MLLVTYIILMHQISKKFKEVTNSLYSKYHVQGTNKLGFLKIKTPMVEKGLNSKRKSVSFFPSWHSSGKSKS